MKQIFTLALLSAILTVQSQAKSEDGDFMEFLSKNNKTYKDAKEFVRRKANYVAASEKVKVLNDKGGQAKFSLNFTADLGDDEYTTMKGLDTSKASGARRLADLDHESHGRQLLDMTPVDWSYLYGSRNVYQVKDQFSCGSCWAFAAAGVMEGMKSIQDTAQAGSFVPPVCLSVQEMVDCTTDTTENRDLFGQTYGTFGCQGGWMSNAWNFSKDQGTSTDADYPYRSNDGLCKQNRANTVVRAGTYGQITTNVGDAVTQLQKGPMTIAVCANGNAWRYYDSGILTSADSCCTELDHAILLVGYGVDVITETTEDQTITDTTTTIRPASRSEKRAQTCTDGSTYSSRKCVTTISTTTTILGGTGTTETAYWLIQNQWGTSWGDQGFIKFAAEGGIGVCGMNQYIEFVNVQ